MEYPKVEKELFNVNNENLQKLASLFPSAVKDGQLDIEALKEELGQFEEVGQEKYELNWAGKQNAKKEARKNVLGKTLRYIEGDGVNEDTTQNLYIEGDNLEVLKLLRKNYYGSIKMIYIDPPYNTGNDFVYNDNFSMTQEELEQMQGERNEYGERLQKNSKDSAKYHTNWLNMMYPRLQLAKDLLTDDGVIFISIDEIELHNLKKLCDEIFGQSNFIADFIWHNKKGGGNDAKFVAVEHEYVVLYAKNIDEVPELFVPYTPEYILRYKEEDEIGKFFWDTFKRKSGKQYYPIVCPDGTILQYDEMGNPISWLRSEPRFKEDLAKGDVRIIKIKDSWSVQFKQRLPEGKKPRSIFLEESIFGKQGTSADGSAEVLELFSKDVFDNPKPLGLIKHILSFNTEKDDIILDFFAGSSTTAHAIMQLNIEDKQNRHFILVQLPALIENEKSNSKTAQNAYELLREKGADTNICEIGKERIKRAGQKIKEEIEQNNVQLKLGEEQKQLPDIGFKVFRVGETTLNWEKLRLQGEDILHDYLAGTSEKDKLDFTPTFKNDLNVVYEIMLRQEGLPLTSTIVKLTDIGSRTYLVADSYLISLEETLTPEMIEKLSALNPLPIKFVFRDSAFDDDIAFKDETFRKLNALIDKNTSEEKKTYTVEFI